VRTLNAAGEFTTPNELSKVPEGAAQRAANVVVDSPGEYTTHRGLEALPDGAPAIDAFTYYAGTIVAHGVDNEMYRLVSGVWQQIPNGPYVPPEGERMDFEEAQGSLFFTTSEGVYRMDTLSADPVTAGVVPGIAATGALTGSAGFLGDGEVTAYRHIWAVNDANGRRLIQGAPSSRLLIANVSGGSRNVDLSIPIPEGLPPEAFIQVYRADSAPSTTTPTDEMFQIYEREPTPTELAAGVVTFTDVTPDTVKGFAAYFSANSGGGLVSSRFEPPVSRFLFQYAESMFYGAVTGQQVLVLSILGVGAPSGLDVGQIIYLQRGNEFEAYLAGASEAFPDQFKVFSGGTPAQNLAQTVDSLIRAINSRSGGIVYAYATDTDGTRPGEFTMYSRSLNGGQFSVFTNGNGQAFVPALPSRLAGVVVMRSGGVVTVTTSQPHGLRVGQQVNHTTTDPLPVDPAYPTGVKVVTSLPTATTFTYAEAGADGIGARDTYIFETVSDAVTSNSNTGSNCFAFSPANEPDSVTLGGYDTVGRYDADLLWGVALDNVAYLGSEDGLYRLSGTPGGGLTKRTWDSTVRFLGRRNVVTIGGQVYALTTQGLMAWGENSKPQPVSVPIEQELRELVMAMPDTIAEYGFMLHDDANRRLYICLPESIDATSATRMHVFHYLTGAWTRVDSTFPGMEDGVTAGLVPIADGRLHLAPAVPGEGLLRSRNTGTDADYQGPEGEAIPARVTYLPATAGDPHRFKQWTWTRIFTKAPTTSIGYCHATDWWPQEECFSMPQLVGTEVEPVTEPVRGLAFRTLIGGNHQRARQLTFSVTHAVAGEPLHLLGWEVKARPYGSGQ
jgi:hypothetical protein